MKILSIGNSFSVNAHTFFNELAADTHAPLTVFNACIGGCTFERHMRHADAWEKNRNDPEGSPYAISKGCSISLRQCLRLKQWDVVTIQQASAFSFLPESFHPHADRLVAYVRKHAPKAEIVVHQTWAYRDDHAFWDRTDFSTDTMYRLSRAAYRAFAAENGFRLIPVGDAFQKARLSKRWGKPILPKPRSRKPVLRSLHCPDKFHANDAGCYLAGCVWLETLLGVDPRTLAWRPESLTEADAACLRELAHQSARAEIRRVAATPR